MFGSSGIWPMSFWGYAITTRSWRKTRQSLIRLMDVFQSVRCPCIHFILMQFFLVNAPLRRFWRTSLPANHPEHPVNELKHAYTVYRTSYNCCSFAIMHTGDVYSAWIALHVTPAELHASQLQGWPAWPWEKDVCSGRSGQSSITLNICCLAA